MATGAATQVEVGLALAAKREGSDRVVAVSFGDGATNTGSFHEAENMAALWDLPMVLVCQNNLYAEMTPTDHTMKIGHVADRAAGYGMPGVTVDDKDPLALAAALGGAIDRARAGEGPTQVECVTFRFRGCYFGDPMAYIPEAQLADAEAADPVPGSAPTWSRPATAPRPSSTGRKPRPSPRWKGWTLKSWTGGPSSRWTCRP